MLTTVNLHEPHCMINTVSPILYTVRFTDLGKLDLIEIQNGSLVSGFSQFLLLYYSPRCLKNEACYTMVKKTQ
jgi:hypothetical protein